MIEEELTALVEAHYADENASLLLLSHVGKLLSDAGLQPEPNDRRSLRQIVEGIADLSVVRDPDAAASSRSCGKEMRSGRKMRSSSAINGTSCGACHVPCYWRSPWSLPKGRRSHCSSRLRSRTRQDQRLAKVGSKSILISGSPESTPPTSMRSMGQQPEISKRVSARGVTDTR